MHHYHKTKKAVNQGKILGMGWVREGHTAPWFHGGETPQLLCPSMGQFSGVFCTVPQAPSDTGLLPPTVATCPLSYPLLAFLSWLTSPIPHNASWDDLLNSLLLTMWKSTHPKVFPLEDYFSMGADFALAKSGKIWRHFWLSQPHGRGVVTGRS